MSATPTPKEIIDLAVTLCKSTGNYVASRIYDDKEKEAYIDGIKDGIQSIVDFVGGGSAAYAIKNRIKDSHRKHPDFLFFKNSRRIRYIQGLYHALEINNKLQERFVDGMSDNIPKVSKSLDIIIDNVDYFK